MAVHPDDLTLGEWDALNIHVTGCPACAAALADYRNMDTLIRHSLVPNSLLELPQDFAFEVEQHREEKQPSKPGLPGQSTALLEEAALIVEQAQEQQKEHILKKGDITRLRALPLLPLTRQSFSFLSGHPSISVVLQIPKYEAQSLQYLKSSIPSFVSEVILIERNSICDATLVVQQSSPVVRVIKQISSSKSRAIREGFDACTGDIIVMSLVTDGSIDLNEIPYFVEALLAGNDWVKGSRFMKGGGSNDRHPLRYLASFVLSKLIKKLFGTPFGDVCYDYNAFWKDCLDYLKINSEGSHVETLLSLSIHKPDFKFVEVPSIEHPDIYGQSRKLHPFRMTFHMLKTIVKARVIRNLHDTHPTMFVQISPNLEDDHRINKVGVKVTLNACCKSSPYLWKSFLFRNSATVQLC